MLASGGGRVEGANLKLALSSAWSAARANPTTLRWDPSWFTSEYDT